MRGGVRNYFVLWLGTLIGAYLVLRFHPLPNHSVDFWMATTSLPLLEGGSVSIPSWSAMPLNQIWYYLILSIAGGITLAEILTIIAQSAIAHRWKRAAIWLSGLLGVALLVYFISFLAYPLGPWRKVGTLVFYSTRGPFWPTLVFAAAIILARLLSNAAQSNTGKARLFLILSGLAMTSVLMMFVVPIFAPGPEKGPLNTFIALVILDGLLYVALALVAVYAVVTLVVVTVRRHHTHIAT